MQSRMNLKGVPFLLICTVAIWGLGAGCNCNPDLNPDGGEDTDSGVDSGTGDDGGGGNEDGGGGETDAGTDGGVIVLPDGGSCTTNNGACDSAGDCCSGYCNGTVCAPVIFCAPSGSCTENTDCCSGNCVGSQCSNDRCNNVGEQCSDGVDCCSGNCNGTTCVQQTGSTCLATGSSCSAGGTACCSQNCRAGICEAAFSCNTTGDVCYRDEECCSLLCSATGSNAGVCQQGSGGFCDQAGTPCVDEGNCCSRVCADPGSGKKVCQAVAGCRVGGDSCTNSLECCGGEGVDDGDVICGAANSLCNNGQGCREPGTICGRPLEADGGCARNPDGTCFTVNAENNCCPGGNSGDYLCHRDEVGVPRCFGGYAAGTCPNGYTGDAPCCIAADDVCNFSDQCCNDALCVPDDTGVRHCTVSTCIALGNTCEPVTDGGNSGCCSGTCLPVGEFSYACQLPGQTPDAGGCQANTESCTTGSQCCSGLCSGGVCVPEALCQGTGNVCSNSGDCCSGLSCVIPSGAASGTCQPGATCANAGQACSPTNLCCNEGSSLQCLNPSGGPCNGTTTCACEFIFGKQSEALPQ